MGEFNTVGLEDIIDAFSRREAATVEAVPKMLKAGADVLIEAQRAEAQAMGLNETGGFINSIKATDVKGDDTEKYVEIYPQGRAKHGNDRKGDKSKVRYATIGFVAEYGTSSHAARPYMTVANEKAHEKVVLIKINLIGFIPEQVRTYLGLDTVGVAEFFALLYIAYEVVSIFKNMALCGLPVKKVWEKVREFLAKYTDELPDTDELDGDSTTGNVEEHRTQER